MELKEFRVQDFLTTPAEVVGYIREAQAVGDEEFLAIALGHAAETLDLPAENLRLDGISLEAKVEIVRRGRDGATHRAQRWVPVAWL